MVAVTIGVSTLSVYGGAPLLIVRVCDCPGCRFTAAGVTENGGAELAGAVAGDADGEAGADAEGEGCGVTRTGGGGGGVTCSAIAKTIENRTTAACIRCRALASLRSDDYTTVMIAGSIEHDESGKLLERFISSYNTGVRTRDFSGFLALLTEDAVLDFEGIPERGPILGRDAIAQHLRDDPPDDQLRVRRWKSGGAEIAAEFAWTDIPESGGCLLVRVRHSRAARITIVLGGPRRTFR